MIYMKVGYDKKKPSTDYVREVLIKDYGIENPKIILNEHGKPYLEGNEYYFSISHTDDMLIFVIAKDEVGLDIEKIRPYDEGVAKKLFTDVEISYAEDNDFTFTEIFAKKESYMKYLGTGLTDQCPDIDVLTNELICSFSYDDYVIAITNACTNISIIELE